MTDPRAAEWGTCSLCGEAFPPNGAKCPTCGALHSVRPGQENALPRRTRRWFKMVQALRVAVVVVVILGLAWATLSGAISGPPTYADPLTTSGWQTVGAGNFTYISGPVTGEDYIQGNYSVENPPGAPLTLEVFNSTDFPDFAAHASAIPLLVINGSAEPFAFAAPYTDTYYFVLVNSFAPSTGIDLHVYVATNYESNVVVD
ncbi:MAG TPA: hypothetical protein VGP88_03980 [Thermoplasmata archaeon]|jgi:hypothetical protein|nr:hypothetical protein [Thermoplasmata archaeon]